MDPRFEICKDSESRFFVRLVNSNGALILITDAYDSYAAAMDGVDRIRTIGDDEDQYDIRESDNGKSYFLLRAYNGDIIGRSEMYTTLADTRKGMAAVMINSETGVVEDLTGGGTSWSQNIT